MAPSQLFQFRDRHLHPQGRRRSAHARTLPRRGRLRGRARAVDEGRHRPRRGPRLPGECAASSPFFAKKREVREWSPSAGAWMTLGPKATIRDACLCRPLAVSDLLDAAPAHDAVARALVEQDNPVIVEVRRKEREDGVAEGSWPRWRASSRGASAWALTDAERETLVERLGRLGPDASATSCSTRMSLSSPRGSPIPPPAEAEPSPRRVGRAVSR